MSAITFIDRANFARSVEAPFIPLNPKRKDPWRGLGVKSKTTDDAKMLEWNRQNPNLNCGIVAVHEPGGIWFLDDDRGTLAATILAETGQDMSPFFRVKTSRGFHYYFEHDDASLALRYGGNTNSGVIDTPEFKGEARTDNQYVLSPFCEHPEGPIYTIENDVVIEPAPLWLLEWLQAKYAKCESLKKATASGPAPATPKSGGIIVDKAPLDPGFKDLAAAIGTEPLIRRIQSLGGVLASVSSLAPGEVIPCPMPAHTHRDYTACFGFQVSNPELLHCLGNCRFTGDIVKAIYALDGYGEKSTMYDCARKICAEEGLRFEEYFPRSTAAQGTIATLSAAAVAGVPIPVDENSEEAIPDFDPSVINGIYAKFVELVTRGTTLAPQYAYVIAKTIVGLRMAGKVKFENLDVEPRFYTALIGATGSGKGEAWRRVEQILRPEGATFNCKIKIIHSADSGAGIKDAFFSAPEDQPVLCYSDEIETLGNKSKDTRNPGILDTMIELADSTSVSRVLAKSKGGTKTKHDARFGMVMCGQDGSVYTKALAGRTKLGLWDRFYPEFSTPQETGDLPPIDLKEAIALLCELNALDYSGTMKMSPEAKAHLDDFWKWQPAEVRKKARWKKNLQLDAYMSAFGCGRKVVEPEDAVIAIKIFQRQLVIRRVCFTTEVPDRVGYYLGLIKRITERMSKQLAAGVPPEMVAKSRRDFETETNAYRDNEVHIFERAWNVHSAVWLERVKVKKANGREYVKFLPLVEE